MTLTQRLEELTKQLQKDVYEKEVIFKLAMLAMLSGESIFLLGKPGIAKSLVARRLKHAFKNGTIFEYLMNRFSTPEEIFGPISIEDLQRGVYKRLIDKYLPTAEIVFLDEIWKAGPSIQNTLLTIINEKIFRNAGVDIKVPMKLLISASNELPAEGQGLEALYDRFIIRYIAQGLKEEENFNDMIAGVTNLDVQVDEALQITHEEYDVWRKEINQVKMEQDTFDFINRFRKAMYVATEGQYYISDRRWKKIAHLMKASAYYNGRDTVDKPDWLVIPYCIWDDEQQEEEYTAIFNEFYLDALTFDVKQKKIRLDKELEELARQYDDIQESISKKSEYYDIFDGKVQGTFHRIFWSDAQYPVCFIRVEDFIDARHNKDQPTLVELYYGEDLDNMHDVMQTEVIYLNDKTLKNLTLNSNMTVEVKNAKGDNSAAEIERKILAVEKEIDSLETAFPDEKHRLLAEPCIFFKEAYYLAVNNAFDGQELKFDESTPN
ncbi:AAA family ATPase [Spiroplasma sp. DGKH1]|uniref:AAA family ATPase n=1 Tax=Spiroplasma sp. DGKH1 TaxID=3050074 RepID=UPI0034C5D268